MARLSSILKLTLLIITAVNSVDIESAKEHVSCKEPPKVAPDVFWCMTVDKWYYITGSRLDLYEFSKIVSGKDYDELREDEIYYDGCFEFVVNVLSLTTDAFVFKQQIKKYEIQPISIFDFTKFNFIGPNGAFAGPCYTSLTDNKTFAFFVCCLSPDEMTWFVTSPFKTLSDDTLKTIEEHARSIGFQQKNFVRLRYDFCENNDQNVFKNLPNKNEL